LLIRGIEASQQRPHPTQADGIFRGVLLA
jgi:hypothetical protein